MELKVSQKARAFSNVNKDPNAESAQTALREIHPDDSPQSLVFREQQNLTARTLHRIDATSLLTAGAQSPGP
jgi:hypothetical protein